VTGHGAKFGRKKEEAIVALLTQRNIEEAARAIQVADPASPPSTRVRAADSVLDHAKQAIEIEDVEVRVAALEQAAALTEQSR
jgi:hypothetical protein